MYGKKFGETQLAYMMCRGSSACVINALADGRGVDIDDIGRKASSLLEMRWTVGMISDSEAQLGLYRSKTLHIGRTHWEGSSFPRCP